MRKLSIITVCLNSGEKLAQTVRTVLAQEYDDWELVIKDGGSADGSVEDLRSLPEVKAALEAGRIRIVCEPDTGIYDGMNQATKLADGEYFYFLNCGDLLHSADALGQMMEGIDANPGSLIHYGDVYDMLRGSVVSSNPRLDAFGCYRNVPCHQACIYHRSLFAQRGYRTEYRIRADYEHFLWSFFCAQANPKYQPVVLSDYEGGGFSETEENRRRSAREHQEIVAQYMTRAQILKYRAVLVLTLQPVRTFLAESKVFGKWYQKAKRVLYR